MTAAVTAAGEFSLDLPPEPIHLGTARTFASQIASHFGCRGDAAMDLELAVSEACSESIEEPSKGNGRPGIRLHAAPEGGRLRFQIEGPGSFAGSRIEGLPGFSRLELIRSLFPDATVSPAGAGTFAVRFSVALGG